MSGPWLRHVKHSAIASKNIKGVYHSLCEPISELRSVTCQV